VALSTLTLALAWRRFAKTAPEGLRLWGGVDWRAFARLWEPTMGNFAVGTMFQTVMIQAPRLILASVAGGSAVALFSIIWALLGMIRQSFEVVIHSMTVEFAFAFGAGDKTLATDLLALGTTTAAGFTAAACVPAIALGPWIISLATKGQIHAQHLLIGVLWSGLAIYSASICFLAALQSSNQSYRTVWPLFWRSAAFVGLAYAMTRVWGIYGLAASVVLYQGSVAIVLVTGTCRAFGIRIRDIVNEALSLRSIKRMLDMVIKPLLKRWLPNPVRGSA
jgi:O-antigen/teichoic acid export membrane protein